MSKRRRGIADLQEVVVEAVVWRDAQRQSRQRFDPDDPMILVTYGVVAYESEDSIWVIGEHSYTPELMRPNHSENQDRTEILKTSVIKRSVLSRFKLTEEEEPEKQ